MSFALPYARNRGTAMNGAESLSCWGFFPGGLVNLALSGK